MKDRRRSCRGGTPATITFQRSSRASQHCHGAWRSRRILRQAALEQEHRMDGVALQALQRFAEVDADSAVAL
jgi:hypothetical protein